MIAKFVLYEVVGVLANTMLTVWLLWFMYSKSKNDEDGRIFNDLSQEYTRLLVRSYNRMFFWKEKRSDGSNVDGPTVEQEARAFDYWYDNEVNAFDWMLVVILFIVAWPYEVIFTKGYTIPRIMAYAKKYDET